MQPPPNLRSMLTGGDRRSIGRADEVAALVHVQPELAGALLDSLWDPDPVVRMRAADAAEKLSRERADLFSPRKAQLSACSLRLHNRSSAGTSP